MSRTGPSPAVTGSGEARGYGPAAAYCPRCGNRLAGPPPTRCGRCAYQLFHNARPATNVIVLDATGTRFLAIRRARPPRAGWWETPGGFCDGAEHPAAAAVRECREELGAEVELGELVGLYPGEYEFQDEVLTVLECFYLATLVGGQLRPDAAEASATAWFPLDAPPPLAFATMDAAVRDVAASLRR
ncbi:NUDIX hydrolase [Solwaraspora sp. WMMA2056]|uniref:NUDIX hydrolase n=1 Tax=Solwaraspora sp. WMMA2056 TaxID=3015161 RepID=UPI00259B861D|nr:NUDIX hydrolase [Solwaraspora sp. WMMA2056]WJK43361.1 NUDIX hydrolase [Solwaraspora sp. WMMA2056]